MVIYYLGIQEINDEMYHTFLQSVSESRREKAKRFYFIEDSFRSVCAEMLLRYAYHLNVGKKESFKIIYNEYGKPYVEGDDSFFFNVSHSGDWVVLAYHQAEIGVDVEKIQKRIVGIEEACFCQEELEYIHEEGGIKKEDRIIEIWTLKESYVKYIGTGLSTDMKSFCVHVNTGVVEDVKSGLKSKARVKSWKLDDDYYLALCYQEADIEMEKIRMKDLYTWCVNWNDK